MKPSGNTKPKAADPKKTTTADVGIRAKETKENFIKKVTFCS
jgi:hypothetical protein